MKRSSLKKNFLYSTGYQILIIILPLITAPYVARVLGAQRVGIYSYTQAFANYFYLFAMLGVGNYGNRAIARVRDDDQKRRTTFWEIYSLQFTMGVITSISYLFSCTFLVKEDRLIYMMQVFYVLSGMFDANWFCFGMENFKLTTMRSVVVRLVTAVCVFSFVHSRDELWLYTMILSLGNLISVIAVWPFVLKYAPFTRVTRAGVKQHIKGNLKLFWPVVAVSLYNIMDKLMLGSLSTKEEVAFYSNAERIVQLPVMIITALDNVLMPRMSNLYASDDKSRARKLMDNMMLFAMFLSCGMAAGLAGLGPTFAPWFYGEAFARCGYFIMLISPIVLFKGWAGAMRTQFIIPTGRDNIYIISLTTGAVTNLILNFILIPRISGVGAIIGTIGAEFAVFFIQFFMTRKDLPMGEYMKNGIGLAVIGLSMFIIIKNISVGGPLTTMVVQFLVGGSYYVALAGIYIVFVRGNRELVTQVLRIIGIKRKEK